jgi:hypothetical protein
MEVTLTDEQIEALAGKIARANLTAADDYVTSEVTQWSEAARARFAVPEAGAPGADGKPASQNKRFEIFRQVRSEAERLTASDRQQEEAARQFRAERDRERAEENARKLEHNRAAHSAAMKQWEATADLARLHGNPTPPQPAAPPLSDSDLYQEEIKARFKI